MGVSEILNYTLATFVSTFGKTLGSVLYLIFILFIVYIMDKIYLGFKKESYFLRKEPRYPKLHISYWVDKYLFNKIRFV